MAESRTGSTGSYTRLFRAALEFIALCYRGTKRRVVFLYFVDSLYLRLPVVGKTRPNVVNFRAAAKNCGGIFGRRFHSACRVLAHASLPPGFERGCVSGDNDDLLPV